MLPCGQPKLISTEFFPGPGQNPFSVIKVRLNNFYQIIRATLFNKAVYDCRLPSRVECAFYIEEGTGSEQASLIAVFD